MNSIMSTINILLLFIDTRMVAIDAPRPWVGDLLRTSKDRNLVEAIQELIGDDFTLSWLKSA